MNLKEVADAALTESEKEFGVEGIVEDEVDAIIKLKNLYRNKRIGKPEFDASLAALLASGVITQAQFNCNRHWCR